MSSHRRCPRSGGVRQTSYRPTSREDGHLDRFFVEDPGHAPETSESKREAGLVLLTSQRTRYDRSLQGIFDRGPRAGVAHVPGCPNEAAFGGSRSDRILDGASHPRQCCCRSPEFRVNLKARRSEHPDTALVVYPRRVWPESIWADRHGAVGRRDTRAGRACAGPCSVYRRRPD